MQESNPANKVTSLLWSLFSVLRVTILPCPFRYCVISQRLEATRCCKSVVHFQTGTRCNETVFHFQTVAIRCNEAVVLFQTVDTRYNKTVVHFQTVVDMETMLPTEKLSPAAVAWCRSIGSSATTLSDILNQRDEKILKALQAGIDRANGRAISRAQKIQKWSVLPHDFSIPGGELGTCGEFLSPLTWMLTLLHGCRTKYILSMQALWSGTILFSCKSDFICLIKNRCEN